MQHFSEYTAVAYCGEEEEADTQGEGWENVQVGSEKEEPRVRIG